MSTTTPAAQTVQPMAIVGGKTIIFDPGLDMLGRTYDVLDAPYAQVSAKGERVVLGIDGHSPTESGRKLVEVDSAAAIYYSFPSTVQASPQNEFLLSSADGTTLETYSDSLALRARVDAGYGAFSGEIKTTLKLTSSSAEKYTYVTLFDSKVTAEASFRQKDLGSGGGLSLDPDFQADLDDTGLAPSAFFDRWGTHLISGIRIGGQIRYTAYRIESSSSGTTDLGVAAKVRYQGLSGSTSASTSTTMTSEEAKEYMSGESELLIYGGSSAAQAAVVSDQDYGGWLATVADNPAFAEFAGLIPAWELCTDPDRAAALKDSYRYRESLALGDAGITVGTGDYTGLDQSAAGAAATAEIDRYADTLSNRQLWLSEDGMEMVVGFGANIDTDNKLNRILVAVRNVRTGTIRFEGVGGTSDPKSYEGWYQVPDGCVITGIELRNDDNDSKNVKVYYQALAPGDAANGFLDPARRVGIAGSEKSSYEVSYIPAPNGNRKVVTGILVRAKKNHAQYEKLVLQTAELTLG
jgi:hypothetical protein